MTIWRMRIVCWIPKAANILTEYIILIAFSLQKWLDECASMLCYAYLFILCIEFQVVCMQTKLPKLLAPDERSNRSGVDTYRPSYLTV